MLKWLLTIAVCRHRVLGVVAPGCADARAWDDCWATTLYGAAATISFPLCPRDRRFAAFTSPSAVRFDRPGHRAVTRAAWMRQNPRRRRRQPWISPVGTACTAASACPQMGGGMGLSSSPGAPLKSAARAASSCSKRCGRRRHRSLKRAHDRRHTLGGAMDIAVVCPPAPPDRGSRPVPESARRRPDQFDAAHLVGDNGGAIRPAASCSLAQIVQQQRGQPHRQIVAATGRRCRRPSSRTPVSISGWYSGPLRHAGTGDRNRQQSSVHRSRGVPRTSATAGDHQAAAISRHTRSGTSAHQSSPLIARPSRRMRARFRRHRKIGEAGGEGRRAGCAPVFADEGRADAERPAPPPRSARPLRWSIRCTGTRHGIDRQVAAKDPLPASPQGGMEGGQQPAGRRLALGADERVLSLVFGCRKRGKSFADRTKALCQHRFRGGADDDVVAILTGRPSSSSRNRAANDGCAHDASADLGTRSGVPGLHRRRNRMASAQGLEPAAAQRQRRSQTPDHRRQTSRRQSRRHRREGAGPAHGDTAGATRFPQGDDARDVGVTSGCARHRVSLHRFPSASPAAAR